MVFGGYTRRCGVAALHHGTMVAGHTKAAKEKSLAVKIRRRQVQAQGRDGTA